MAIQVPASLYRIGKVLDVLYSSMKAENDYTQAREVRKDAELRQRISNQISESRKQLVNTRAIQSVKDDETVKTLLTEQATNIANEISGRGYKFDKQAYIHNLVGIGLKSRQPFLKEDQIMRKQRRNERKAQPVDKKPERFNFRGVKEHNSICSPNPQMGSYNPRPIEIDVYDHVYEDQFNYPYYAKRAEMNLVAGVGTSWGVVENELYSEVVARYGIQTAKTPPSQADFLNIMTYVTNMVGAIFKLDNIMALGCDNINQPLRYQRQLVAGDAKYQMYRQTVLECFLRDMALPPRIVGLIREFSKYVSFTDTKMVGGLIIDAPQLLIQTSNFTADPNYAYTQMSTYYDTYITPWISRIKELARLFPEWRGEVNLDSLALRQFMWVNGPHDHATIASKYPSTDASGATVRMYIPEGLMDFAWILPSIYIVPTAQWVDGYMARSSIGSDLLYYDGTNHQAVNDGYEARYSRVPVPYNGYTYSMDILQSIVISTNLLEMKRAKAARWLWDVCSQVGLS